jgi:hypothetical protein
MTDDAAVLAALDAEFTADLRAAERRLLELAAKAEAISPGLRIEHACDLWLSPEEAAEARELWQLIAAAHLPPLGPGE